MSVAIEQRSEGLPWLRSLVMMGSALVLAGFLLVFLIVVRWIEPKAEVLTLRSVQGIDDVAMPAPPPPPPEVEPTPTPPPPPAATMDLPKLDLSINEAAPPIKAMMAETPLEVMMKPAQFAKAQPPPKANSLYASKDLDGQPRLLNRPRVNFPSSLKRRGVSEGRVVLEVLINKAGVVNVRRVVSSSHPDLVPMAKTFATRARFSSPKKDGRTVNALFNWPLLLRP